MFKPITYKNKDLLLHNVYTIPITLCLYVICFHTHTPGDYRDCVPHEPLAMPWKPNHAVQSAVCLRLYTHRCAYRSANRRSHAPRPKCWISHRALASLWLPYTLFHAYACINLPMSARAKAIKHSRSNWHVVISGTSVIKTLFLPNLRSHVYVMDLVIFRLLISSFGITALIDTHGPRMWLICRIGRSALFLMEAIRSCDIS